MDAHFAKQGMKMLYTVPWPPQGIYSNRTLNSAADLKGLKWRAYSPATSKIAELVGAEPVTVKAAADAETRGWKLSEEKNGWYLAQLKDKGMSVFAPSEQLTADLRKVGNYMLAEWLRKAGDDGHKVIDAYRAM